MSAAVNWLCCGKCIRGCFQRPGLRSNTSGEAPRACQVVLNLGERRYLGLESLPPDLNDKALELKAQNISELDLSRYSSGQTGSGKPILAQLLKTVMKHSY